VAPRGGGRPARPGHPHRFPTFIDPRVEGAKLNPRTTQDLIEVVSLAGREWLFYKAFPLNVCFIRGTTADEKGNITLEQEPAYLEVLPMAMATRNSGGIVIAQVKRLAQAGSLPGKLVKVPHTMVDHIVVHPSQWQSVESESTRPTAARSRSRLLAPRHGAGRAQGDRPPRRPGGGAAAPGDPETSASACRTGGPGGGGRGDPGSHHAHDRAGDHRRVPAPGVVFGMSSNPRRSSTRLPVRFLRRGRPGPDLPGPAPRRTRRATST